MTASVCRGLASLGWSVHEHAVPGFWRATRRGVVRRPRRRHGADPRRRRRAARRTDRLDGSRGARAAGAPVAPGRARAHAARSPPGRPRGRRGPDAGTRGPVGRRRRRHDQRVDAAPAARAVRVARRPGARRRARRSTPPTSRRRDRGRRGAALRRGGDLRQGPRRAARCAGDDLGPVLALRVRGQPGPRPGVRGGAPSPRHWTAGWTTACTSRDRGPGPISTAATPPRTWWCWRRAPRRTAWSSPRRWPVACR